MVMLRYLGFAVMLGLFVWLIYASVDYLQTIYLTATSLLIRLGIILVFVFTILVILRYLLLMFFSILQTLKRLSDIGTENLDHHKVSILVPCYNEQEVIVSSLKSMITQTFPRFEILVIDDGSSDQTYALAKKMEFDDGHRSLRVLRKRNGGKSTALNFGIKHATGDLTCTVDADSKLDKEAIGLMVQHFKDPKIAAVAGSVYVANQNNFLTKLQALEYIEGLNMVRNGQSFLKLVNIIPGPIGMFRKEAISRVGLYEHDTFAEDCDLTMKLIAHGYKIDFEPNAISYTEAPENLFDLLKQRYRWTRGILQSIKKHRSALWNWKVPSMSFVTWYMLFEAVLWPFMQLWGDLFIIYLALSTGMSHLLFFWWMIFTILDISGAIFCLTITGARLELAWMAIWYRIYFIAIINIAKILATLEEWFNIEMNWGKLPRKGRI
jgi:cellulose synthase/poly-beta-1,6-N-acetylglucosamine synthase-like glycosyltransferase